MAQANLPADVWVNSKHPHPAQKAPPGEVGLLGWLRANLFSSLINTGLTLITALVILWVVSGLLRWGAQAAWEPIWANRKLLAVGGYPSERLLQPMLVLMLFSLLLGISAGRWGSLVRNLAIGLGVLLLLWTILPAGSWTQTRMSIALALLLTGYLLGRILPLANSLLGWAWVAAIPGALIILHGGITLLGWQWYPLGAGVPSNLYGGLLLTFLLTIIGITCSFPIGVALALGRRSQLPAIRYFCIAYIELIRGVPLISLLFMAMVVLPLFLPAGMASPANVTRAAVAVTLFSAAYLAETVRGGLQAVPKGQWEAADALGLTGWQKQRLIVLPQALRAVIPALVGQFIGLFKDTSLVALVGLTDFLNAARSILVQPAWSQIAGGITREVYLAVALSYLIFSFGMSWASRRLESQLGVGKR
jgi:general L-amino acid transport system permease protein